MLSCRTLGRHSEYTYEESATHLKLLHAQQERLGHIAIPDQRFASRTALTSARRWAPRGRHKRPCC